MATSSFAQQLRKAVVSDAVAKYELEMAITDRGEVPDAGFFLMRIVLTDDPKQDELERVAGVGDLFEWEIDPDPQRYETARTSTEPASSPRSTKTSRKPSRQGFLPNRSTPWSMITSPTTRS